MKYKCVTKCYHNNRLYQKDEVVEFGKGQHVPEHFVPYKPVVEQINEAVAQGKVKSLEEMNTFALRAMAKAGGIELPATATKAEIIAAMRSE